MPLTKFLEEQQQQHYLQHQQRLQAIRPIIDNQLIKPKNSSQYLNHRKYRQQRAAVDLRHNFEKRHTFLENIRLVQRIQEIQQRPAYVAPTAASHPSTIPHAQPSSRSLTHSERQQSFLKICVENDHLVHRLLNVKPTVDRQHQLQDFERHQAAVRQHSKFRGGFGMKAKQPLYEPLHHQQSHLYQPRVSYAADPLHPQDTEQSRMHSQPSEAYLADTYMGVDHHHTGRASLSMPMPAASSVNVAHMGIEHPHTMSRSSVSMPMTAPAAPAINADEMTVEHLLQDR